jgi:hypothetical protein
VSENPIDKLNAAFDKYDQQQEASRSETEKRKTEHEIYLENFRKKCKDVIGPAMEEMGKAIENRGHKYKITQEDEIIDSEGRTTAANIVFEIHPEGKQPDYINHRFPQLSFVAGTYNKGIYSHVSTMMPNSSGLSGKNRDYKLSEITKEAVQEEIADLVTTCFGK